MCKSERDVCVALLFVVCYYHRICSLPRAQSGRADHTLQSMQAPSVAFTMGVSGVEGGSATLTSMKQHSHRLVKKLTSSACRATRYGQRLRTVLSGSPRCTRASMPRQFGVRGFRLGRALDFNMSLHVEELQVYDSLPLGASAYDTCYTVTRSTMAAPMGASTTGDGAVPLAVRLPLTWVDFVTPPFGGLNAGACRFCFECVATIDEHGDVTVKT